MLKGSVNIFAVWPQASRGASPGPRTGRGLLCDAEVLHIVDTHACLCPGLGTLCELVLSPVWELMAKSLALLSGNFA